MAKQRLGLRQVQALKPSEIVWDPSLPGFGARRQLSEAVSYVLFYRTKEGRQRWYTIGRHGAPWTPDAARAEAVRLLGEIANGGDPAATKGAKRQGETVTKLCDLYLADAEAGRILTRRKVMKKASTLAFDRGRIECHIKPLLGSLKVAAVTREDIDAFMHDVAAGKTVATTKSAKNRGLSRVRGGKSTASRTVGFLGALFDYAIRRGMRADNPAHGVMRFADGKRDRRLSNDEYAAAGKALCKAKAEGVWPASIAAAHFLLLTGWRRNEALELRWNEIDLVRRTATLGDTKTGRSMRPLSHRACEVLRQQPRSFDHSLVFPATRGDGIMVGFPKMWAKIAKLADLPPDITPHVLRHSFASLGGDLGYSEPTIGALIGHKGRTMTSRYVHAADAVLLAAADAIADRTAELMGETQPVGIVIELRKASA